MQAFLEGLHLDELNEASIVLRLLMAAVFSGVLGLERTRKRRAAGFRTYILVCLGAAVVMMTGEYLAQRFPGDTDPARIAAQVISGIGFLGAGTIIMTGVQQVRGLTTAAGLWASACMGIAIGAGFYFGSAVMFAAILVVMVVFDAVQARISSRSKRIQLYTVLEGLDNISDFIELASKKGFRIHDYYTSKPEGLSGVGAVFMLSFPKRVSHGEIIAMVKDCKGLKFVEEI